MVSIIGSIVIGIVAIMTLLVTLGLPLGEFVMGGKYKIVPPKMRIATGISLIIQLFAIIIVLQAGGLISIWLPETVTKYICFFFAGYLVVNTIMNLQSTRKKEKYFATPLSIIASICFWVTAFNM